MERVRIASAFVLLLALGSWVLALGGLGNINAVRCGTDVSKPLEIAKCSRTWSWEWWCLFYEFFLILAAGLVTCLSAKRLAAGRYVIAQLMATASAIIMVALHNDLGLYVWTYFDVAPLFSDFTGDARILYMSGSALCAGWILLLIFNVAWVASVLTHDIVTDDSKAKGPIVGSPVTGAENVQVRVA